MTNNLKIGDSIGIYKILGDSKILTKDGHKQLHVKCLSCGIEKDIRPINLGATVCNHKQKIIPRYCKYCGQIIPFTDNTKVTSYKKRNFCNSSCAAKLNNKRSHSESSKLKASNTALAKRYGENLELQEIQRQAAQALKIQARSRKNASQYYAEDLIEGKDYVICPYCNLRVSQLQNRHLKLHNKNTVDLLTEFGNDYKLVSDVAYAKKVKAGQEVQKRLIANGTHKGWQSRNITSYAEQFWMQVLDNNEINYSREVPVKHEKSNYFLDFVIERSGKFIDLEIDGKQHCYEDRKSSDITRDLYLTECGYLIYRIMWNEVNSEAGKKLMQEKINDFLNFYATLK